MLHLVDCKDRLDVQVIERITILGMLPITEVELA
jgi:hypothetical protein